MALETFSQKLPDPAIFEAEIIHFLQDFRFDGARPSLAHISAVSHYFSRLPYENISKIIKYGQTTGPELFRLPGEVLEDHAAWHLGGTCFSLTYFLIGIYTILGYQTQPIICDLNWGKHNHSAIRIKFGYRSYLVDPGYMIFTPLPLEQKTVQTQLSADTGIELRFRQETENYTLYTFRRGQYTRRYQFMDREIQYSDFAKYWQASFALPGMDDLILTRVEGYEMTYIQGDFIKITSPQKTEKFRESNRAEHLIKDRFKIPLSKVEEARYILQSKATEKMPEVT